MVRKTLTLEDHVQSIIAAKGPDGALKTMYQHHELQDILARIHERGELPDLRAYHFYGTFNVWQLPDGNKNLELAREAIAELVEILKQRYGWELEDIVRNITSRHFREEEMLFGATLGGMLQVAYRGSPSEAIMDYLRNHPDVDVRKEFAKLRPYHFRKAQSGTWTNKDGTKNLELAREATEELLDVLKQRYGWELEEVVRNITSRHFYEEEIMFGATLGGMLNGAYRGSPSEAVIDYLQNHPDRNVREKFRIVRPYHFSMSPLGTWTRKDGTKNYELAREATAELIETLQQRYGWGLDDVICNIRLCHFDYEEIRFGATLGGMLATVYGNSPSTAICDYMTHRHAK